MIRVIINMSRKLTVAFPHIKLTRFEYVRYLYLHAARFVTQYAFGETAYSACNVICATKCNAQYYAQISKGCVACSN